MEILFLILGIAVIVAIIWWSIRRYNFKELKSHNRCRWGNLLARINYMKETKQPKCQKIMDGLERNCTQTIWVNLKAELANIDLKQVKDELCEMRVSDDGSYASQKKYKERIEQLEDVADANDETLSEIDRLPKKIVNAKMGVKKKTIEIQTLINQMEMLINNGNSIPKKLQRAAEEKRRLYLNVTANLGAAMEIDWFRQEDLLDRLFSELNNVIQNLKNEYERRDKCLEILKKLPEKLTEWESIQSSDDKEIDQLIDEAADLYDHAKLILGYNTNYEIVTTDWDIVGSFLFKAWDLYDRAEMALEIKKLSN